MTYVLTFQAATHARPFVRVYDTEEEAEEMIKTLTSWFEEERIPWKLKPTVRVEQ